MELRIIAASLTLEHLELIKEDGESVYIKQGHPQLQELVNKVLPVVSAGKVVVINTEDINPVSTVYGNVTKKSNGIIRFLRIAKNTIKEIFSDKKEEHISLDQHAINTANKVQEIVDTINLTEPTGMSDLTEEETVVAVIDNKIVPGVEKIVSHLHHALNKLGSTEGIENFLRRAGSVIQQRHHSIEDLMKFLEKADLPIANDGSIIIYKGLKNTQKEGIFVDCHTKLVKQKVGSRVFMSPSLVDWSRDNDCSSGLHVARKGYLRGFPLDVITICKVNPEDVIVVPKYDPKKMRVCAYHILSVLPPEAAKRVTSTQSFDDIPEAAKLLSDAITGKHIHITQEVEITGSHGTGLVITDIDPVEPEKKEPEVTSAPVQEEPEINSHHGSQVEEVTEVPQYTAEKVDVMEVSRKVVSETKKPKAKSKSNKQTSAPAKKQGMSRAEEIQTLVKLWKEDQDRKSRKDTLINLLDLKKASKKPFQALGVSDADAKRLMEAAKNL